MTVDRPSRTSTLPVLMEFALPASAQRAAEPMTFPRSRIHRFLLLALLSAINACGTEGMLDPAVDLPGATTASVSMITAHAALSGGEVVQDGGDSVVARGVCWSTSPGPTTADARTVDGSGLGTFVSSLTGLAEGQLYYVRAYATNRGGTAYGQEVSFRTASANPLLDSLVAYWSLDENAGLTAADAAGGWDLSLINSPAWTVSGKLGGALDFGTVSSRYAERIGVSSGNVNTYTLASWVYLVDGSADAKVIMGLNSGVFATNAGSADVKLYLSADNRLVASYHTVDGWTGPMLRVSGAALSLNTWHHVVGVIDNGDVRLYIDGVLDEANAVSSPIATPLNFTGGRATVGTGRLYEGAYLTTRWFRGRIDEAGIWRRALSQDEVAALYNGGAGSAYPF